MGSPRHSVVGDFFRTWGKVLSQQDVSSYTFLYQNLIITH